MNTQTLFDVAQRVTATTFERAVALANGTAEPANDTEAGIVDALRQGWQTAEAATSGALVPKPAAMTEAFAGLGPEDQA